MRAKTLVTTIMAAALVAAPLASLAQGGGGGGQSSARAGMQQGRGDLDRARAQDRTRDYAQERERKQDRVHVPDSAVQAGKGIYGEQLMTKAEKDQYRKRMQSAKTEQEREKIAAEHRNQMQIRAKEMNVDPDNPGKGTD